MINDIIAMDEICKLMNTRKLLYFINRLVKVEG